MSDTVLSAFFKPKGVAVIGASRNTEKLGYSVVYNLVTHKFDGAIYPINPVADEILGHKSYPTILDAPDPLDLAVIVVPAKYVAGVLEECGKRGVQAVTIVSGGFREVGAEGVAREEQIKAIARKYDIAVMGPNCIGSIDTHTPLNATFVTSGHPRAGQIALVSQSGAVAAAVIDWARGSGVGFSRIASMGNQTVVQEAAMLEAIAEDINTDVVISYIEGVNDGRAYLEAASRVAKHKPVVALKAGRSSSGAKAVASHTGALAGTEAAYDAAFRRAGVLRAERMEEMLDWARALAWQPLPNGNRVGVLTNAGGAGVMAVDALEAEGMELAPLTPETKAFLRQRVPPAASIENPVDILAGSGPATYALCLDALIADETVDAVVVMTAPQDWFAPVSLAEVVGEVANSPLGRRKPVLAVIMGLASTSDATQVLHRRRTPNFAFPERIGITLAAMWQRRQWLDAQDDGTPTVPVRRHQHDIAEAAIQSGLADRQQRIEADGMDKVNAGWMSPEQVEQLMVAYDIPTPRSELADTVEVALEAADSIGYPVALKLAAEGVTHKTDVGGVQINLKTPEALTQSFQAMIQRDNVHDIQGAYVQQMIHGEAEIIVGVVRDPQFGPLVMVGSGGTQVELMGDVTFELAPVSRQQANEMMDRTTIGHLMDGYRGKAPANRDAVIDIVQLLAQLALDWEQVAEIEINPVIVMTNGAYAVDVRVRLDI